MAIYQASDRAQSDPAQSDPDLHNVNCFWYSFINFSPKQLYTLIFKRCILCKRWCKLQVRVVGHLCVSEERRIWRRGSHDRQCIGGTRIARMARVEVNGSAICDGEMCLCYQSSYRAFHSSRIGTFQKPPQQPLNNLSSKKFPSHGHCYLVRATWAWRQVLRGRM